MLRRIFLASILIICIFIKYSIPLMKSLSSIWSAAHQPALFLTQSGIKFVDEEYWFTVQGMKEIEIILLLIKYSIPVKNSISEISLFAHHPAVFLIQSGI